METETRLDKVAAGEPVNSGSPHTEAVRRQLSWKYEFDKAATHRSKQSVSELKRNHEVRDDESGTGLLRKFAKPLLNRPKFMQEKEMTPAEKGTAMHMVMQHVDLSRPVTEESLHELLDIMVRKELLYPEQKDAVELKWILAFFDSEIGRRLLASKNVKREVPFYLSLPAPEVYPDWAGQEEDIFIQGVVDCVFEDEQGMVLLDFKTDGIQDRFRGGFEQAKPVLADRYKVQIELYAKALEQIWKRPVEERYLFFFDGGHLLKLD
jgi:ATP-dependent helicase/nuclease subunit A